MATRDFDTSSLRGKSKKVADSIVDFLTRRLGTSPDGGGCKAFYSKEEWRNQGHSDCGTKVILILCHDGGDLSPYCNLDYEVYSAYEAFQKMLDEKHGVWVEQGSSWYSVVYSS
jgi:hypothetical protein